MSKIIVGYIFSLYFSLIRTRYYLYAMRNILTEDTYMIRSSNIKSCIKHFFWKEIKSKKSRLNIQLHLRSELYDLEFPITCVQEYQLLYSRKLVTVLEYTKIVLRIRKSQLKFLGRIMWKWGWNLKPHETYLGQERKGRLRSTDLMSLCAMISRRLSGA